MKNKEIYLVKLGNSSRCLVCNESNCLNYLLDEPKILHCTVCDAAFIENEYVYKGTEHSNPQSILTKTVSMKLEEMSAQSYLRYLKTKTGMKFKNALDIGAGHGQFVKLLNDLEIDALGVESNPDAVKQSVTEKMKLAFFDTTFELRTNYDLITLLNDTLSYFRDNHSILNHIRSMLNPAGMIFFTILNIKSPIARKTMVNWPECTNMILSKKNIESLSGFEMVDYATYRNNYSQDLQKSKFSIMKYMLRLKEAYEPDPDGEIAFVLLRKQP